MNAVVDAPASGLPLLGRVLAPPDAPADAHAEKRAEEQERARSYCRDAARRIRRDADVLDALVRWDDELPGLPSLALTVTVRQGGDLTRVVDMVTDTVLPDLERDLGADNARTQADFVVSSARSRFSLGPHAIISTVRIA